MKIVGRQAGKYWLETVDLSGMAHEIQGNCVSSLGFVLSDPQLYERLVWICQRSLVGNIIEVHVTRPTLDMEINISAPSKKVLEEYMELGVEHKLSQNLLAALIAVEERVTCLLMPSMAEFFVDPVVVAHYKKIQASERAGLRLMSGVLLKVSVLRAWIQYRKPNVTNDAIIASFVGTPSLGFLSTCDIHVAPVNPYSHIHVRVSCGRIHRRASILA
eukprot:CFRG0663T1